MKVDTITEKLPKDSHSLTKSDVKIIAKELLFDTLNAPDDKLTKTKYHTDLLAEIKAKTETGSHGGGGNLGKGGPMGIGGQERREGSKASFTAGQALREKEASSKLPKETLQECLNEK